MTTFEVSPSHQQSGHRIVKVPLSVADLPPHFVVSNIRCSAYYVFDFHVITAVQTCFPFFVLLVLNLIIVQRLVAQKREYVSFSTFHNSEFLLLHSQIFQFLLYEALVIIADTKNKWTRKSAVGEGVSRVYPIPIS